MNLSLTLEEKKNKTSINKDFYQPLTFEKTSMAIPVSDTSDIVNSYQIFENERENSTIYNLNVTLNPIMSNVLTNKLTEIRQKNNGTLLTGYTRLNAIQTIDDTQYDYKLGYDIFDNNFMRIDTFKTGTTLNSFTGKLLYNVLSIQNSISNNLIEDNGWLSITNKTKINGVKMFSNKKPCEKINLFPTKDYLVFNPNYVNGELFDNWSFLLTYPYESYKKNILTTTLDGINGIPIIKCKLENYSGNKYLVVSCVYSHKLKSNDIIKLKTSNSGDTKSYIVYDVGDVNKNNKEYSFILDADKYQNLIEFANETNIRVCRVINEIDSEYYIRKFRKLPNFTDFDSVINDDNVSDMLDSIDTDFLKEEYRPGFSRNIYNDLLYQIQYIDDININYLTDNLNRPLSEIYFTLIKKNVEDGDYEPNNSFTKVMSGIETFTGVTGYSNIRIINGVDNVEKPLEDKISKNGTYVDEILDDDCYFGDIVEYNASTVNEIKITDIMHRFNTTQREQKHDFIFSDIYGDGANIFKHSTIDNGTFEWYGRNSVISNGGKQLVFGDNVNCVKIVNDGLNPNCGCVNFQPIIYEKNRIYQVSFYAKANGFGLSLDNVGVADLPEFGTYSFSLTSSWERYSMTFVGDGKRHNLIFQSTEINSNTFYITKIKIEQNETLSNWSLNPIEDKYVFIKKTIHMNELKEGYMYKPHYKIQLKEFSDIINSGEFPELIPCNNFVSGMTDDNDIVILNGQKNIKNLFLKITSIDNLHNFDKIRITDDRTNKFINLRVIISSSFNNTIIIPYVSFFDDLEVLNISNYTIRRYANSDTPTYCQDTYDGKCLWRNILKEGEFINLPNGGEHIFTNGRFYLKEIFNVYLRRQDPFGIYNLRNDIFPADSFGNVDNTQIVNNIIEKSENVC